MEPDPQGLGVKTALRVVEPVDVYRPRSTVLSPRASAPRVDAVVRARLRVAELAD